MASEQSPQSVPPTVAVPAVPPGDPRLAEIAACWPKLITSLGATRPAVAACLARGRPVLIEGDTLKLEFPPDRQFDVNFCDEHAHRALIAESLSAAGAGRWTPAFRLGVADPNAAAPTASSGTNVPRVSRQDVAAVVSDPLISAAMEMFGARVVNIEKDE